MTTYEQPTIVERLEDTELRYEALTAAYDDALDLLRARDERIASLEKALEQREIWLTEDSARASQNTDLRTALRETLEAPRELEADARPSELEALQISYEDLTERYDTALETITDLRAQLAKAQDSAYERGAWLDTAAEVIAGRQCPGVFRRTCDQAPDGVYCPTCGAKLDALCKQAGV